MIDRSDSDPLRVVRRFLTWDRRFKKARDKDKPFGASPKPLGPDASDPVNS
ncbi:MAG: hypothetical protein MI923_12200 [Phycisphaerales bacterium]|nr:hypothetical protein [Phycisphaerales bacterium]